MYVHGGGWVMGGPRRSAAYLDWPKVLASLAAEGYVVVSVGYRFSREAPFPAASQDVKAAIRWLRVNAAKYNLDPTRGMTMGQSAGGHLAALAAVSCGVPLLQPPARVVPAARNVETSPSSAEGTDEASDCVRGAVAWFGIYDLESAYAQRVESTVPNVLDLFLDCKDAPCPTSQLREASPVSYIDAKDPPMLLMHGTDDQTVSSEQTTRFHAALQAAGVQTRMVIIPGVGHSWIGKTPQATRDTSKRALQESIDFIEATIGDAATKR
jgi:acetyl esterase/lipase